MYKQGRKFEKKGDIVQAYLLFSQAAAKDPSEPKYWARSQALRRQAALKAQSAPSAAAAPLESTEIAPEPGDIATPEEIEKARQPQPPVELSASEERKSFDLRENARGLFERVARAYGLDVVFDGEYPEGQPQRVRLDDASYREALHALQTATSSFLVPISEKLLLVVKDTPQKRQEVENTMSVIVPLPEPVSVQEATELARSVQQLMEIQKFAVDNTRRLVLIRDRVSKVRAAQRLFEQLLYHRPIVSIEVELLTVAKTSSISFGLQLPTRFPLVNFGDIRGGIRSIPEGFKNFLVFGGGKTFLGIGIGNAELFASATKAQTHSMLRAEVRSLDGQPAQFHVGDKYPILTAGYIGGNTTPDQQVYAPPPTFNFEDLGLSLKLTPKVHDAEEVSLDLEAEFKVLGAQSINGIPVISNNKFATRVRLRFDESAVVSGLMSATDARTLSALAGIGNIPILSPLLSRNTRSHDSGEVLLVIRPRLLSQPASEIATREVWTGTESRPRLPL